MADAGLTNAELSSQRNEANDLMRERRVEWLTMFLEMLALIPDPQEEHDRRWRNMSAYVEALPEAEKATTLGGHRDVLAKFGINLGSPMSAEDAAKTADFGVFMEGYAGHGLNLADSYEMEGLPDAKPKCDRCKMVGATRRCQCGEWYCSKECKRAARRKHRKICRMVRRPPSMMELFEGLALGL